MSCHSAGGGHQACSQNRVRNQCRDHHTRIGGGTGNRVIASKVWSSENFQNLYFLINRFYSSEIDLNFGYETKLEQ